MSKKAGRKKSDKAAVNRTHIEEDSALVQECIQTLRELLQGEKNLKVRTDDKFMLRYLRWQNFDPELAFSKLKEIYKFRAETKEWHCNKPPCEYETIHSLNCQVMLGERDNRGRRVYVVKVGNVDMNNKAVTVEQLNHVDDMWLELMLEEEEVQKNGIAVIIDLAGYSWKMFRWLTPTNVRISSRKLYNLSFPSISFHVVNTSFLLNASIAIVYPFLDSKIKEQIHFHNNDWSSLHKHINPDILPAEYGGYLPGIDYEKLRRVLYDNTDVLMAQFSMGYVDE
ncbi:clavesin-1-like [Periplaneta americana]|uniref:clavesin-1-like n=1 Tax=Periplaneta americana TaxID=6978 RepID=UPI0037E98D85